MISADNLGATLKHTKMYSMSLYTKLLSLSIIGLTVSHSHSAITWGAAQDIGTEASDVITTGILHAAVNAAVDDAADITLNGVMFESGDINAATNVLTTGFTQSNAADLNVALQGDTTDYQNFLGDIDFGSGTDSGDITIENLIDGQQYIIQAWFVDDRTGLNGLRVTTLSSVGGNDVDLNDQFAVGTFTADGTTQIFNVATAGAAAPNFTGFQVRAVPEPSSTALLGLGGFSLLLMRRRSAR